MDVMTIFLNENLDECIYILQPNGFIEKAKEHFVCVEVNFTRKLSTLKFARERKTTQNTIKFRRKTRKGENHGARKGRDSIKSKGLQGTLQTLLQIQFSRVQSL